MGTIEDVFKKFPVLETDRLILRDIDIEDYSDIYDIYSDVDVLKYNGIDTLKSLQEAIIYTKRIKEGYSVGFFLRWAVLLKDTEKMIGTIGIHHIESWNYKLEIGYILNKDYWRQGYSYEALCEIIRYLFDDLNIFRIEASIHPDNRPSIRLAEKLGFVLEGKKRKSAFNFRTEGFEDRLLFSLLRCDERRYG